MTLKRLMELSNLDEKKAKAILQEMEQEQEGKQEVSDEEREEIEQEYQEKLKEMAVRYAIQTAGGKNEKAILALVDLEKVELLEDGKLSGLDLEALKDEVPYLFQTLEKKTKGTGFSSSTTNNKKKQTAKVFKDALLRR